MLKVINPANGAEIATLEEDTDKTIAEKYALARRGQPEWARVPLGERIRRIQAFRELLVKKKDELARTLTSEVGKPITQAHNEVNGTLARLDFFVEHVGRTLADEVVFGDSAGKLREKIAHEPLGVIASVSAWNYPYFVGSNVFLPALLAGNAVLYKPSEFASLTGQHVAALLHEAGVPADVFVPVIGDGKVGAALVKQPVNGVFFTGSHGTGKKIAETLAGRMMRVQMELGGKDPIFVADDVVAETAAEGVADGAFYNTGQSCCAVERIYVHQGIYDAFVAAFIRTVQGFKIGDPMDQGTYIGPLTRKAQLDVLEAQVKDAVKKGAKLILGGKRIDRPGAYFEPTVLVDVDHTMEVMREESFGPIIGIQRVDYDEEALRLMNDTEYGLTAGVYSTSEERATRILSRVNAGSVYWNCCDRVSARLPWSGRGHSGVGTTLSTYGILSFVQPKAWHLRRG